MRLVDVRLLQLLPVLSDLRRCCQVDLTRHRNDWFTVCPGLPYRHSSRDSLGRRSPVDIQGHVLAIFFDGHTPIALGIERIARTKELVPRNIRLSLRARIDAA